MNPGWTARGIRRWRARCLVDRVREARELVELTPEPGPLLEEVPRDRRVARARLLDQRRAHGRRLGRREVGEDAAEDAFGDEQLVVVPESGDELPARLEPALAHGAELLEHLDHAEELVPVRAPDLLERALPDAETLGQCLELAPLALTPRLGAPGTAVALDRGERAFRPLLPLALDQLGDRQSSELDGQVAEPAAVAAPPLRGTIEVARHVERRCGPEGRTEERRVGKGADGRG